MKIQRVFKDSTEAEGICFMIESYQVQTIQQHQNSISKHKQVFDKTCSPIVKGKLAGILALLISSHVIFREVS